MAIQVDVVGDRGALYPAQYVRVDEVLCTKSEMSIVVGVYFTQQQAVEGVPPHMIEHFAGSFDMHSEHNAWQQAYAQVKQRWPEAIDV